MSVYSLRAAKLTLRMPIPGLSLNNPRYLGVVANMYLIVPIIIDRMPRLSETIDATRRDIAAAIHLSSRPE
jgi:hypothetical protein